MSDFEILIRGRDQDIGIADGKFAALGPNLSGSAVEEVDGTNLSIFPGVIDAHVHFNEPGRTDWEGFETGSQACATGGTTTVFDMPLNAHPPTIDVASFDKKRAAAETNSLVDFGLWGGLVPQNLVELPGLGDRGVVGLKAFLCNSGMDDFPKIDLPTLREGMRIASDLKLLVAVHAESEDLTRRLTEQYRSTGALEIKDYLESRPIEAELEAIHQAIECARETGCRLHIVHVSCGRGVELVTEARASGIDVTCETCPHYLLMSSDDMLEIGAPAKCAPPLRSRTDRGQLLKALGHVATVGSDHSPSPPEMKQQKSFFDVWGGISGCQHLLVGLMNAEVSHTEIARLTSTDVATRFRISNKGGIAVGKDADLCLVDPAAEQTVTPESLRYRHKQSAYVGRRFRAQVIRTILRGQTIYQDGKVFARPIGRLVRPSRS
jgi:allantoinase